MNITSATFRCSSQKLSQCPADNRHEFAFIGRSNVGKSSLINMLTDSPSLAKVSSTPGKTKLINHFLINGNWYLVDLPGYGYARVSKSERREFSKLILDYVLERKQMHFLFVLVDSRLEPQKIDLDFINLLGEHGIPFGIGSENSGGLLCQSASPSADTGRSAGTSAAVGPSSGTSAQAHHHRSGRLYWRH